MHTFTSIDFELATSEYNSVCAVGLVSVVDGDIVNEFYSLVQPPENKYMWQTTRVHGIKAKDTINAPSFIQLFPELLPLVYGQKMVAHNEELDRKVLRLCMQHSGLVYEDLGLQEKWDCTSKIYKGLGFTKTKLSIVCEIMGIQLNPHDALSDARASAELFLNKDLAKLKLEKYLTINQ
ncbi:exonuclease domain-containing protein [Sphingobacterium bovistauri]|uniref:3'-5' exoribonuclease n=1 Tax=Sphingobacterium bovistauri TaxID=2781959 RepID=A0ABS7Z1L9_9SPHI|nr:exonuclease domain-containing protein [Sphingobacterium bovistauri]MCA5004069.1 3'-5' exoribonuclease [Sphingobacterium bovistauri]